MHIGPASGHPRNQGFEQPFRCSDYTSSFLFRASHRQQRGYNITQDWTQKSQSTKDIIEDHSTIVLVQKNWIIWTELDILLLTNRDDRNLFKTRTDQIE